MAHVGDIDSAWDVVQAFVADWQREPYRWNKEIDVQVEIAGRLTNVLRRTGRETFLANYRNAVRGFEHNQTWSRVTCEPPVPYTFEDGKRYDCFPDIVIWDDIEDQDHPPDDPPRHEAFPIAWACEIKYRGQPQRPRKEGGWDDQEKLRTLMKTSLRFGCCLTLARSRASEGEGVKWDRELEGGRLWVCTAQLPASTSQFQKQRLTANG